MNSFGNYKNRGVELPEGCKDLIDVLDLARVSALAAQTDGVTTQQGNAESVVRCDEEL